MTGDKGKFYSVQYVFLEHHLLSPLLAGNNRTDDDTPWSALSVPPPLNFPVELPPDADIDTLLDDAAFVERLHEVSWSNGNYNYFSV